MKQGLAHEARAAVANSSTGAKTGPAASVGLNRPGKERRKRKYPYRKAAEIEQEIAQRESRIGELHRLFGSEDVLRDGNKVKELKGELDEHQAALPHLYEHWEEATEMN